MTADSAVKAPTAADFRARHRGGGLFTETVNQWIASHLAVASYRRAIRPTVLSLTNLVIGLGAAALVTVVAAPVATGKVPAWLPGLAALALWQFAYSLDCADGQLARLTGQSSPEGARVDVLTDVAVQIALVTAVSATAVAHRPGTPAWLVAVFAGTWMVNVVTGVLGSGSTTASMITSRSLSVRVLKLIRDYGAVVTVVGLVLAFAPAQMVWLMVAFTVINGVFLLVSIAHVARTSLRRPA